MAVNSGRLRILPQHLLPQTTVIAVLWEKRLIGTVSIIEESPLGLPMENTFDLASRRAAGGRLAELSSLAIAPHHRGKTEQLLFPLLKFIYQHVLRTNRIDEITIAVEPKMADLYQALMLYHPIEKGTKKYGATNSVPAVALHRNLQELEVDARRIYRKAPPHRNLWAYFNSEAPSDSAPSRPWDSSKHHYMTPNRAGNNRAIR